MTFRIKFYWSSYILASRVLSVELFLHETLNFSFISYRQMSSKKRSIRSGSSVLSIKSQQSAGYRYHDGKVLTPPNPENVRSYLFEHLTGECHLTFRYTVWSSQFKNKPKGLMKRNPTSQKFCISWESVQPKECQVSTCLNTKLLSVTEKQLK